MILKFYISREDVNTVRILGVTEPLNFILITIY